MIGAMPEVKLNIQKTTKLSFPDALGESLRAELQKREPDFRVSAQNLQRRMSREESLPGRSGLRNFRGRSGARRPVGRSSC